MRRRDRGAPEALRTSPPIAAVPARSGTPWSADRPDPDTTADRPRIPATTIAHLALRRTAVIPALELLDGQRPSGVLLRLWPAPAIHGMNAGLPAAEFFVAVVPGARPAEQFDVLILDQLAPSVVRLTLGPGDRVVRARTVR
jgi:hypothetical protein